MGMRMKWMSGLVVLLAMVGMSGCKSAYVAATIRNESGATVSLVELDYPSASFGKDVLGNGAEYDYRFKILGNGPTKIQWTDAKGQARSVDGPELDEGQQGSLAIVLNAQGGATWSVRLHR